MNIIVIGGGSVGSAICTQLAKEGHSITVLETNQEVLTDLSNRCDVIGLTAYGADVDALRRAGAEHADLLIAVASEDEVNILCCAVAKKLGCAHTIARVRNPEYASLMKFMRTDMGLSMTINPEYAAAREISRILRFPAATKIDTFCGGKVDLAEITVSAGSPLCGATLNELRNRLNCRFLVCGVLRGDKTYIPSGLFSIEDGDTICVTAPEEEITRFFKAIGENKRPVRDVLIVGGSRTTYYLEALLEREGISSTVIEKDRDRCVDLAGRYRGATIVCEDGTSQDLLIEEGIEHTDAFLALSDSDEENAIVSMFAKTKDVPKVVTMISALSYVDFFRSVGLDTIVSPKSSTATYILRYVRAMANAQDSGIEAMHTILDGRVEALEFSVRDDIPGLTDVTLREMNRVPGTLIACIVRDGEVIFPTGSDRIGKGDTVIVVSTGHRMDSIRDILK